MSRQIIKHPNGQYAIWSTVVDDFIEMNLTPAGVLEFFNVEAVELSTKNIRTTLKKLESGKKPYFQFTMTWEEALEFRKEVHGDKPLPKVEGGMNYGCGNE